MGGMNECTPGVMKGARSRRWPKATMRPFFTGTPSTCAHLHHTPTSKTADLSVSQSKGMHTFQSQQAKNVGSTAVLASGCCTSGRREVGVQALTLD